MLDKIIGESWVPVIGQEFQKPYLQNLAAWITQLREVKTIYPSSEDVFRALQLTPNGQVKVIVIGQDPYYNGVADGLAFSYKNGSKASTKQSLDVIFNEIEQDCYNGFNPSFDYDLSYLAKQGVLLLNTALTVERNKAASHVGKGWEVLTKTILLSQIRDFSPKVILTWGKLAEEFVDSVFRYDEKENGFSNYIHLVLKAPHPASDLYKRDMLGQIKPDFPNTFTGCKHFSKANEFLLYNNMTAIDWFPVEEPHFNVKLSDKPPF